MGQMEEKNTRIGRCLNADVYVNDRFPGKAKFSGRSRQKVGKQNP